MKKRLTMFLACLFLSLGIAMAQTQISGTVISSEDGQPVIGASVVVNGTKEAAATDIDGRFTISASPGSKITVSYIGMKTVTLAAQNNMTVTLTPDEATIEEVVVTGYGSAKKVGTVVGSVSTVQAGKINNAPSASALDALQGQVAGLSVLSSSGVAGDNGVSTTLHGVGSLGAGSAPLYIVDGIPSSSRTVMAMNPNDIKSISVLKDASATSIYGSRAANGVIFVTTKSGSFNAKATITYRTQYGWSTLANTELFDNMMSSQQLKNFWIAAGYETEASIKENYTDKGYDADTKWYKVMQQFNNPQTQNDISIEGGSERIAYMVGASQFHQRGTTIGNYYNRYTFRTNIDARPIKWVRIGMNVNLSYDQRRTNANFGSSSGNSTYLQGGLSYMLNPLYPSIDPETGKLYAEKFPNDMTNPYYLMEKNPAETQRYGMVGSTYFEITPIQNLKWTTRVGGDMAVYRGNSAELPSYISASGQGYRGKSFQFDSSLTMTNTLEYKFSLNDQNHFTVLAGHEGVINNFDSFTASSSGQKDDRIITLQNGTPDSRTMSESMTRSKFLSFFGRVDYNLQDKYFFDASIRNDASSRFGRNNRNATFWAAGAMWKIGREKFMREVKWVNDLNVKLSYGTQGNAAIGDYAALGLISEGKKYDGGTTFYYSAVDSPDLTWEEQKLLTLGVSGTVFNRVEFDFQYYNRKTSSMLMAVPYAYTTGYTSIMQNVGAMQNTGFDARIQVNILRGRDYYLNFNTTFNYNNAKITELFQGRQRWEIANTGVAYVVGDAISYYYPIYAGVDPTDGKQMWYLPGENVDVKTTKETTKEFSDALAQNTGKKRYAPVNGGFGLSAGWKGLSFAADFAYVLGKYMINNDEYFYANPNSFAGFNQTAAVADFWTAENPNALYPDWKSGATMRFDTHLLQNASFLRLKNLQIGYDLPKSLLGFQNVVKGLKFTITARNLLTFTSYKGMDPEINTNVSLGQVGNTKQFLLGAEISF